MRYYHEKDKSLSFIMPTSPSLKINTEETTYFRNEDIDGIIEQLKIAKEEGFKDVRYYDDGIVLWKTKTQEQIKEDTKERQELFNKWKKEHDSKMQTLESAYRKKLELAAIMNSL